MICTWFEIYQDDRSAWIYKMDAEGNALAMTMMSDRVDEICRYLLSESTAKTVLFAPPGKTPPKLVSQQDQAAFSRIKLAKFAETEAGKGYAWRGTGKAKIYTKKFEPVFGTSRFSWCAAFVTYCCEQSGLKMPVNAPTGYTFALCEAWQQWAIKQNFYHDNDGKFLPKAGDIVLFDWEQTAIDAPDIDWEDHIGVVIRDSHEARAAIRTAEGNVQDCAQIRWREMVLVQGFIRIPDGFKFP